MTVALILDDGDGIYEPGVDQIIATDITDENGQYLFPDLPAGSYFVAVMDTENILGEVSPTYDADGGLNERSFVTVNGVDDNLLQDFGYAPPGQEPGGRFKLVTRSGWIVTAVGTSIPVRDWKAFVLS